MVEKSDREDWQGVTCDSKDMEQKDHSCDQLAEQSQLQEDEVGEEDSVSNLAREDIVRPVQTLVVAHVHHNPRQQKHQ